ncbi:MAG: hypothetical protein ACK55J_05870, partial [Alphaproteobacteria bacterium]
AFGGWVSGRAKPSLTYAIPHFPLRFPPPPAYSLAMREVSRRFGLDHGVSAPAGACALLGLRLIRPWA